MRQRVFLQMLERRGARISRILGERCSSQGERNLHRCRLQRGGKHHSVPCACSG